MVLREVIDFSDVSWIRAKLACEFLARFVFPFTQFLRGQITYDFRQVRSRLSSDLKRDFNSLVGIHLADYSCSGQSFAVASGEFDAVCHCCSPRRGNYFVGGLTLCLYNGLVKQVIIFSLWNTSGS